MSGPFRRVLVLGGARSGKSRLAQQWAERAGLPKTFIATAQAFDEEMRERIEQHRAERGDGWQTSEAPIALAETIRRASAPDRVVLVDCLTLWLSNILLAECDPDTEAAALAECIATSAGPLILVSNEVGHGIVPATPLGRRFRDAQGRLNQQVAAACDAVVFVAAGCPTLLKPVPTLDLTLA